jgi:ubiquinol-cytochrome c reductase cytochrome b/c1 subunit
MASISVTPAHLVPEWYFLPFYAVLRATPDKFGGLLLMVLMIVDLFLLDIILDDKENDYTLKDIEKITENSGNSEHDIEHDIDTGTFLVLFFLGGKDIDEPYTDLATVITI